MLRYISGSELCFKTQVLKFWITFSKTIPKKYKSSFKEKLIHTHPVKSFSNSKYLFSHLFFFHSYDLFTTAILSILQRNARSLELLLRALLENYFMTEYIEKNPEKIKQIFTKENLFWSEAMKWNKNADKRLFDIYNKILSKQAHPTPTRLLSGIDFVSFLIPKQKDMQEFLHLSPEERIKRFDEFFEKDRKPSPGLSFSPHPKIQNLEQKISDLIYIFDMIKINLDEIEKNCPDCNIEDESWEEIIKKYKKI